MYIPLKQNIVRAHYCSVIRRLVLLKCTSALLLCYEAPRATQVYECITALLWGTMRYSSVRAHRSSRLDSLLYCLYGLLSNNPGMVNRDDFELLIDSVDAVTLMTYDYSHPRRYYMCLACMLPVICVLTAFVLSLGCVFACTSCYYSKWSMMTMFFRVFLC